MDPNPKRYSRIARRIRVPLTFVFTVVCLWIAQPSWNSIAMGALVMVFGILLRARAAGHVQKDKVLTMTGPYAYTRNPLYLGSILLAIGFGVAAQNVWIGVVMVTLFLAIYIPIIRAEEEYLRATFAGYGEYMKAVPRLLPRLTPAKLQLESGGFSMQRYLKLREYNSIIGALVLLAVLSAKILWSMRAAH